VVSNINKKTILKHNVPNFHKMVNFVTLTNETAVNKTSWGSVGSTTQR